MTYEPELEKIENEAILLGKKYIHLLCLEKIDSLDKSKSKEYHDLVKEWSNDNKTHYPPCFDELVEYEYNKTLEDKPYVEKTLNSLIKKAVKYNIEELWLLIDDVRDMNVGAIARTPKMAKTLLSSLKWEGVIFDYDLNSNENGYDVLEWAIENNLLPKKIKIITENPKGMIKMEKILKKNGFYKNEPDSIFYLRPL